MANCFVVFDHLHSKFVDCIIKLLFCMKFFTYCRFPNIFTDVVSPNSRVESKFLHVLNCDDVNHAFIYSLLDPVPKLDLSNRYWVHLWSLLSYLHAFLCYDAQMTPRPCPRLLPTFKAWLLSTYCFVSMAKEFQLYGMFQSDNLETSDQKSILSLRCRKFKWKRRYDKWNFAFFRLDKCERWQQLLCRCLKPWLFVLVCL